MWKLIVLLTLFYEVFGVKSPNFVLIITDDQDLLLDGLVCIKLTWSYVNTILLYIDILSDIDK